MSASVRGALVAAAFLAVPVAAQAHLVNSGLGPLYDGVLHLLLSPGDLLGLVASGLLAGLGGVRAGRLTVIALPVAWLVGGAIGMSFPTVPALPWFSVLSFMVLGGLVAADVRLPAVVVATLTGAFGVVHGLLNGSTLVALGAEPSALCGMWLTVLVMVLFMAAAVVAVRTFWIRIAVRVAGSWIVAVGMLMVGWLAQSPK